jgi:hypothetical protein
MGLDRTDLEDLYAREPEVARALAAKRGEWAKCVGVEPWPVRRPKKAP